LLNFRRIFAVIAILTKLISRISPDEEESQADQAASAPLAESAQSSDASLAYLAVDGNLVEGFDPGYYAYTVETGPDESVAVIEANPTDPAASVSGAGPVSLSQGDNEAFVEVTAQDGTKLRYRLAIRRPVEQAEGSDVVFSPEMLMANFHTNGVYGVEYANETSGRSSSQAISISSAEFTTAYFFVDIINLQPGQLYEASVWAKGENVESERGGFVGICIHKGVDTEWTGDYGAAGAAGTTGTFDWRRLSYTFRAEADGTNEIRLSLGYSAAYGDAKGKAVFDGLEVRPFSGTIATQGNVRVALSSEIAALAGPERAARLAEVFSSAYASLSELTGTEPDSARFLDIFMANSHASLAYASNPISFDKDYASQAVAAYESSGYIPLELLGEVSSAFDAEEWNFSAPFFRDLKTAYVVERQNLAFESAAAKGRGEEIALSYAQAKARLASGSADYAGLVGACLDIAADHGWEPFKTAFRTTAASGAAMTKVQRYEAFFEEISKACGEEVRGKYISEEAWQAITGDLNQK